MPAPIRQSLASTYYDTDGVTTVWNFSFSGGYLDQSHVKAFTQGGDVRTPYALSPGNFTGPYQLTISPALADGLIFGIYRDTPKDLPIVDFTDGSGLSEVALDVSAKQAVFIGAEAFDLDSSSAEAQVSAADSQNSADAAAASSIAASNSSVAADFFAAAAAASAVLAAANVVSPAMGPVVSAASIAAGQTAFGLSSLGVALVGSSSSPTARGYLGVAPRATRVNVGSASTVDLTSSVPENDDIALTGTSTITSFTVAAGRVLRVRASGIFNITASGSIVTQHGNTIKTAVGDSFVIRATAANVVEILSYTYAQSPTFSLYVNGTSNIPSNVYTQIVSLAEEYDTANAVVGNSFVCPVAGIYKFHGQIWFTSTVPDALAAIFVNGVNRKIGRGMNFHALVTAGLHLNAGDVVTLHGYQTAIYTVQLQLGSAYSWFTGALITRT